MTPSTRVDMLSRIDLHPSGRVGLGAMPDLYGRIEVAEDRDSFLSAA
jgi:hypothetical protein